jgi:hypothetical protein
VLVSTARGPAGRVAGAHSKGSSAGWRVLTASCVELKFSLRCGGKETNQSARNGQVWRVGVGGWFGGFTTHGRARGQRRLSNRVWQRLAARIAKEARANSGKSNT